MNLESLTDTLKVRRKDIRGAVSQLHREGMLDALTMRLSLRGFAIGRSLQGEQLRELRITAPACARRRGLIPERRGALSGEKPAHFRQRAR